MTESIDLVELQDQIVAVNTLCAQKDWGAALHASIDLTGMIKKLTIEK